MVYYPKPMHEQTAFRGLKQYVPCPVTERLCKMVVSLPLDGYKKYDDVSAIEMALYQKPKSVIR
jgi:dTDP-4-amino-4,6-dideoxygalactose transaminase